MLYLDSMIMLKYSCFEYDWVLFDCKMLLDNLLGMLCLMDIFEKYGINSYILKEIIDFVEVIF